MWDDDFQSTPQAPAVFEETGFSVGRGRGFGNMSNMKTSLPDVGGKSSFTSAPATNNNEDSAWNDDWDDSSTQQNNYNSTNNYNSNSSSNYGSRQNNKACFKCNEVHFGKYCPNSRTGYNKKKGSSCYNCHEDGHMSRDCPNAKSERNDNCFKCGEAGHKSRECPNSDGGGQKKNSCYNCGEEGHMSRECPNPKSGGQKKGNCYNCGEDGHMSRECPNPKKDGERKSNCYNCGEDGHMSRECPNPKKDGERKSNCYNCGEDGHMSRECPNPKKDGDRKNKCFKCGEEGHMSRDCTNEDSRGGGGRSSKCFKCGEDGHMSRECPSSDNKNACFRCGEEGHMSKDCTNPDTRTGPDGKPRAPLYIPPDPSEDASDIFQTVSAGINFRKYDSIAVDVSGQNKPPPITSFQGANLSQLLLKNIQKSGYDVPTPIQKYCIPIIMNKRDVMACAETGSGKTAAFLLPMLHNMITDPNLPNNANNDVQEPIAVILAPTRELAIQIASEARKFSYDSVVKTEVIYGGTSTGHQSARIKRGIHILVATPGRLHDFVDKGKVSFANTKYLVLDEADRMLDMGFMPAIEKIVDNSEIPPKGQRQTLMFSATFADEIQKLAAKFLEDYLFVTVGNVGGANSDVTQTFFKLGQFDKRQKLMDILNESGTDRVLVFVEQKRTADFLASFTSQNNIPTTSIHGDRLQKEREEALRDFKVGKMPVLVATAVAARGLDIKDVRHVINYDLPQSIDEYVHRIGRTGRVGNLGKATSFYDSNTDQPIARSLKKILMDANQEIPDWLNEEASMAVGTAPQSGRGNFGGRDFRSQGRATKADSSEAWDNNAPSNDYSQPAAEEESWDF